MKVTAIIQARMNSTRLPGKIVRKVLGKSLLEYQIERVRRTTLIDEIVIATTTNEEDEQILNICKALDIAYFRGSENDVLSRYYEAATAFKSDIIVRLTSDCPLIDPYTIDQVITYYLTHQTNCDYVSNILNRTYPRGMDTEVFSFHSLQIAYQEAVSAHDREHVTPFIYNHLERFRLGSIQLPNNQSHHRWTVDTIEDMHLITQMLEALYPVKPQFNLQDMLELLENHPEWSEINAFVSQK